MELTQRMRRFYRKPAVEKWKTIRFLARRQWANAAFLPMPISLDLAGAEDDIDIAITQALIFL